MGPLGLTESDLVSPLLGNPSAADYVDAFGEWMAIAESTAPGPSEYLIFSDPLGFCPIFLAELPGKGLIATDSFSGAVHALADSGISPTLDTGHYLSSVDSKHPHFENPYVRRTMANEIRILPADKALMVRGDSAFLVDRSHLSDSHRLYSYEELITQGIEFTSKALRSLPPNTSLRKSINLSGGVDSRLTLALLSAAGVASDFTVNSVDPRTWQNSSTREVIEKDIAIANQVRHDLGLEWTPPVDRLRLQFDFQDSLAFHQSFRSNFAFTFSPTTGHTIQKGLGLTIRGGGGEMLRSTTTALKVSADIRGNRWGLKTESSPQEQVLSWYLRRSKLKGAAAELVHDHMHEAIMSLDGSTLEEVMNNQYLHNRNRTHFGHLRQSNTTNNTSIHLLANPFFLQARNLLSFRERMDGKLVRDIYHQTDASLLDYPFESEASTAELSNSNHRKINVADEAWSQEYDSIKETSTTSTVAAGWSAQERGILSPFDRPAAVDAYLRSSLRLVEDAAEPDHRRTLRKVHRSLLEAPGMTQRGKNYLAAKAASAVDLQFPTGASGTAVHLNVSPASSKNGFRPTSLRPRDVPRDGWNDQAVQELLPRLILTERRFKVLVDTNISENPHKEFAFYLYRDTKRVDKSWYESSLARVFDYVPAPGDYFVRMFSRLNGSKRIDYTIDSDTFTVSET